MKGKRFFIFFLVSPSRAIQRLSKTAEEGWNKKRVWKKEWADSYTSDGEKGDGGGEASPDLVFLSMVFWTRNKKEGKPVIRSGIFSSQKERDCFFFVGLVLSFSLITNGSPILFLYRGRRQCSDQTAFYHRKKATQKNIKAPQPPF